MRPRWESSLAETCHQGPQPTTPTLTEHDKQPSPASSQDKKMGRTAAQGGLQDDQH